MAGLVALNGPLLVCGPHQPTTTALEQYWSTSKLRFESWMESLDSCAALTIEGSPENLDRWTGVRAALDEIFTSEILTRVWTAVLVASDRRAKTDHAGPIARSVLAWQYEARGRAMSLLVRADGLAGRRAAPVNRLRRRAERWTDLLIGGLLHLSDVREFAFEAERAEDFRVDLANRRAQPGGDQAWRLALVAMRKAFDQGLSPLAANPDANARVTASILGCFPAELFDSTGMFHSVWMLRLTTAASDAQGMIDELLRGADQSDARRGRHPRPGRLI